MKKRYIITPKDYKAVIKLDLDTADQSDLFELILSENDYLKLERVNFFYYINELINSNIDDFEDEIIRGKENIEKIIRFIDLFNKDDDQISVLLKEIKVLFEEALVRGTGVYFYF